MIEFGVVFLARAPEYPKEESLEIWAWGPSASRQGS